MVHSLLSFWLQPCSLAHEKRPCEETCVPRAMAFPMHTLLYDSSLSTLIFYSRTGDFYLSVPAEHNFWLETHFGIPNCV